MSLAYSARIERVSFSLSGSEAAARESCVQVRTHDLFRDSQPYDGGVFDAHMGTTDHAYKCKTCQLSKRDCPGHFGHIQLNYPVWSPLAFAEIKKWVKLICFECGKPIIAATAYMRAHAKTRLEEASKIARAQIRKCVHCGVAHPIVKKDVTETLALVATFRDDNKYYLYPHQVKKIFDRIGDSTVTQLGRPLSSHPRVFVLSAIRVPPVTMRPDVKKLGGRSTYDDLTMMLQVIVKKSDALPAVEPEAIDNKLHKAIFELNSAYYDFIKASGDNAMQSIAMRLKGKQGRFRKNQMGKRVRNMCRSTITGDPKIQIGELGVPLVFARTIQIAEPVQEYNRARLLLYIRNGRSKYPGATSVIRGGALSGAGTYITGGIKYDVEHTTDIQPGDIVLRDVIDGDIVSFNRQPSLCVSNIAAHRVKVIQNPRHLTITMNVIACALYNADFDGDQMNLIFNCSMCPRYEVSVLSRVANWFISHTTSAPAIGQVDDSIIGTAELTRTGVQFDRYHAMLLFADCVYDRMPMPALGAQRFVDSKGAPKYITGREIVTELLKHYPINYSRATEWYKETYAPYFRYDPADRVAKITNGVLTSGVLDKRSIAANSTGNIFHVLALEYSPDVAMSIMYNMQQLAIGYIYQYGYTIGIKDLLLPRKAQDEINKISQDIIVQSARIADDLINGEIIAPIGKTIEEFYEEKQIAALRILDDFLDPVLRYIGREDTNAQVDTSIIQPTPENNLFKLIAFGSKGKIEHLFSMVSTIGQKLINGARIWENFGYKRTLPYCQRFDTAPTARGYICNSILAGLNSVEYIFAAMAARFDLISKALLTSVTGEQERKSVKNLESNIASNLYMVMKNQNITQILYGEDGLDPRAVEKVRFPTVMLADAEFEAEYEYAPAGAASVDLYSNFYARMLEDRKKYREIFMRVELSNTKELFTDERRVPVNVARVIENVLSMRAGAHTASSNMTAQQLPELIAYINHFTDTLPYIFTNERRAAAGAYKPEHHCAAVWLTAMLLRTHLHPRALLAHSITMQELIVIANKTKYIYQRALVDPGTAVGIIAALSFSWPLTQYMIDAHHRAASGGTSKTGMGQAKEVLGAKPTEKLAAPSMLLAMDQTVRTDRARVQEIANSIEVMHLRQFVTRWQIYFEKYGEPVHPATAHERALIQEFAKYNPLLTPPSDLVKWCIRITLDRTTMILKNMPLDLIVSRLRALYPDLYLVYAPENIRAGTTADAGANALILRVYMRTLCFKTATNLSAVADIKNKLLNTIIRGINGIQSAEVVRMIRSHVTPAGAIETVPDSAAQWGIKTLGTNLAGTMFTKHIDLTQIQTSAIQETYAVLGIEAARQRIISELRNLVDVCNHRHYLIYADEMTYTGRVTSIESAGLKTREASNVLLRVGFVSPMQTLEEAAVSALEDSITGVTAPLLVGSTPRLGTLYNKFHMNEQFVRENVKQASDYISDLY